MLHLPPCALTDSPVFFPVLYLILSYPTAPNAGRPGIFFLSVVNNQFQPSTSAHTNFTPDLTQHPTPTLWVAQGRRRQSRGSTACHILSCAWSYLTPHLVPFYHVLSCLARCAFLFAFVHDFGVRFFAGESHEEQRQKTGCARGGRAGCLPARAAGGGDDGGEKLTFHAVSRFFVSFSSIFVPLRIVSRCFASFWRHFLVCRIPILGKISFLRMPHAGIYCSKSSSFCIMRRLLIFGCCRSHLFFLPLVNNSILRLDRRPSHNQAHGR